MLESAAFMGLLVPGEALVVATGFFAAQGLLDLKDVVVLVACGAILGDSIGHEGLAWLALCLTAVETLQRRNEFHRDAGER